MLSVRPRSYNTEIGEPPTKRARISIPTETKSYEELVSSALSHIKNQAPKLAMRDLTKAFIIHKGTQNSDSPDLAIDAVHKLQDYLAIDQIQFDPQSPLAPIFKKLLFCKNELAESKGPQHFILEHNRRFNSDFNSAYECFYKILLKLQFLTDQDFIKLREASNLEKVEMEMFGLIVGLDLDLDVLGKNILSKLTAIFKNANRGDLPRLFEASFKPTNSMAEIYDQLEKGHSLRLRIDHKVKLLLSMR